MNLAYFRASGRQLEETAEQLTSQATKQGWKHLGDVDLPEGAGKMILLCRTQWLKKLLQLDKNLVGFLPCAVSLIKQGDKILVGTGQTAILKALAQNPQLAELAAEADGEIKKLIDGAAGVETLKPKGVKLYSTMSCPYCKMEKAWLEDKKIKHEVIYVDLNQQAAEDMVKKTGQMGVPVTEIEYDEGESEFVVGFDRPRLEQILNVK